MRPGYSDLKGTELWCQGHAKCFVRSSGELEQLHPIPLSEGLFQEKTPFFVVVCSYLFSFGFSYLEALDDIRAG